MHYSTPWARRRPQLLSFLLTAGAATASVVPALAAAQDANVRVLRTPGVVSLMRTPLSDRPVLGILMAAGSRADTAGVHIEEVDANGPAAQAGLKAGDVITDINGTSLRVSREDADDLALAGLAQRRLQRVLAKAKPGDDIALMVRSGNGAPRKVTVKSTSAAALERNDDRRVVESRIVRERRMGSDSVREVRITERGMVGMTVGGAGNARDTLGLFISSVVTGGPAEKAGIVEGDRVAAVNGVDVRLSREDIDDAQALSARVNRFVREVQKAEPGKTVALRVYSGGRFREVSVTAARASELPRTGFRMSVGDGGFEFMAPEPPMSPRPGAAPRPPQPPRVFELQRDGDIARLRLDGQEIRVDMPQLREQLRESIEEMRRGIERGIERGVVGSRRAIELQQLPSRSRRAVIIL